MMEDTHRIVRSIASGHRRLYLFIQHDEFKPWQFWGLLIGELFVETNSCDPHFPAGMIWTDLLQWDAGHPAFIVCRQQLLVGTTNNSVMQAQGRRQMRYNVHERARAHKKYLKTGTRVFGHSITVTPQIIYARSHMRTIYKGTTQNLGFPYKQYFLC